MNAGGEFEYLEGTFLDITWSPRYQLIYSYNNGGTSSGAFVTNENIRLGMADLSDRAGSSDGTSDSEGVVITPKDKKTAGSNFLSTPSNNIEVSDGKNGESILATYTIQTDAEDAEYHQIVITSVECIYSYEGTTERKNQTIDVTPEIADQGVRIVTIIPKVEN